MMKEEPQTELDKWIEFTVWPKNPAIDYETILDEIEELLKTKPTTISTHNATVIIMHHFESQFGFEMCFKSMQRECKRRSEP